jgi:hypothetical protein
MKKGAGEDPFAEDAGEPDAEDGSDARPAAADDAADDAAETGDDRGRGAIQIPYKFRRDGVQDGRDRVPLFVKPETKREERDARRDLEDRFGEDVSLTDLREALVKVGLDHLDEVEGQLEDWGYGMTFEE